MAERVAAAGLGAATDALAPGRAAHNALWDALAAALLLKHFAGTLGLTTPGAIVHAAAVKNKAVPVAAPTLFD